MPKILKRGHDDAYLIQCGFCSGLGRYPLDPNELLDQVCPACEGAGAVWFPPGSDEPTVCQKCEGKGRRSGYFYGDRCEVCKGIGAIDLAAIASRVGESANFDFWQALHPEIVKTSKARFEAGHYADAVEAAFKEFNAGVKRLAGAAAGDRDGATLMTHVFSVSNPLLLLANTETESGRNIQQGYMLMFQGGMIGIRNPKTHDNLVITADRAVHLLFVASLFMQKLDEATEK